METEILKKSKTKSVPKLRFREFQENWSSQKLGNLITSISSGKTKPGENGSFPVYGSTEIIGKSKEFTHDGNYILIARVGANAGKIQRVTGKFSVTDNTLVLVSKEDIFLPSFAELFLLNYNLNRLIFGSGQPLITGGLVKSIKLNLPTLSEQQKIAAFLSSVDKKIQQLTRKKALLETYKKGLMQKLFSQEIRFRDENGKDFPEWEEKTLGELADRITQKNTDDKINFVLTNSATQGIISQNDYFDRDIANQNNLQGYYVVSKDDFVYNPRISVHAPVGPIKRNKFRKGVMSPLYSVFRFKDDKNLVFLEYFFETVLWHKYLNSVANFGARHDRMNISLNDFYLMPIPFPAVEEQQKIADFLSAIDKKIEAVSKQIEKTQTFKKGLLQQMFV